MFACSYLKNAAWSFSDLNSNEIHVYKLYMHMPNDGCFTDGVVSLRNAVITDPCQVHGAQYLNLHGCSTNYAFDEIGHSCAKSNRWMSIQRVSNRYGITVWLCRYVGSNLKIACFRGCTGHVALQELDQRFKYLICVLLCHVQSSMAHHAH